MSEAKPPGPDAEKLAKQLQVSLAKRRPTTWKPVLVVLGLCTLLLASFIWWMKPRPPLPLLPLVALDAVYTPDETPYARVQLFTAAEAEVSRSPSGQDVHFQGLEFVQAGRTTNTLKVRSDSRGQAAAELPKNPPHALTEFQARPIDEAHALKGVPDSGQVFVWPGDAKLLIVDVDEVLMAKELDVNAAGTLKKANAAGWRIVYMASAGTQAAEFRQARNWLQEQPDLPAGPALGRPHYPSQAPAEQARSELLQSLGGRFSGSKVVVVKSAETAALCKKLQLRTIVIGVSSWVEVLDQLK